MTVWTSFGTQSFQNIELVSLRSCKSTSKSNGLPGFQRQLRRLLLELSSDVCWRLHHRSAFWGKQPDDPIDLRHHRAPGAPGRSSQEETGGEDFLEEGVVEVSEVLVPLLGTFL
eukprot:750076-Hanusia_phi.AAC.5